MTQTPLSAKLGLACLAAAFGIGCASYLLLADDQFVLADAAGEVGAESDVGPAPEIDADSLRTEHPPTQQGTQRVVAKGPRLRVGDNQLDFGVVAVGQELAHTFVLHNDGDADLEIAKAKPSCGCAALNYDKVIPAGGEGKFEVRVSGKSVRAGLMSHRIEIESNQPDFWLMTVRAKVDASVPAPQPTADASSR